MPNDKKKQFTYKDSGVNLNKAGKAIELIKKPVSSTFSKNVLNDLTSYAGLFSFDNKKYRQPVLVSSTDGVGTKLLIAKEANSFAGIGQDLVGMCINDILCCGAMPLFFLDYIACGRLDPQKVKIIVESIAASCSECKTALIGGEIAEMPDIYSKDNIDLAGFVVGVVEKASVIKPGLVKKNDIIVGLPSSGVHSNGFSLVRKIIKDKKIKLSHKMDKQRNTTLADALLVPTKLYFAIISKLLDRGINLHGIAHITGGGFYENINRIIPKNLNALINIGSWEIPGIFNFLKNAGNISKNEMFRVFNMGIGMVLVIDPADYDKVKKISSQAGEKIFKIGIMAEGNGGVLING
ncbi:MAG: phosphoribosylformylglycinamidine cyclo-ligase [Candidatus Atribacteria bacterium]|nr:phosphoribosylformylglycinamidine cyclo-ligase [Candidatus Atribacteria bacterium]